MVQFLGFNIKMYGEPRSSMTPLPIFPASFTSAITASAEKSHPKEIFQLVMKNLDSSCINPA
jgi:hypothetical protein